MSNFIREINSKKWKQHNAEYILSIADMDIPIHQPFRNKFLQKIENMNNLTYKQPSADYYNAIKKWYSNRFIKDPQNGIKDQEILTSCSLFTMTNVAVSYFSQRGDGILVFAPCYIHYDNIIRVLGRIPVEVELQTEKNGLETRFYIDFEKLEKKAKQAKVLIFVNPNNNTGRIWSKQQIDKIVQICKKHDILFVSDEILCDLIPSDKLKNFYSMVNCDYDKVIVGNNVGKAFNVSSAKGGYVIIRNKQTRDKYSSFIKILGIDLSQFAIIFTQICYTEEGCNWLGLIQNKITRNYQKMKIFANSNHLYISKQEAAFLVVIGFQNYMPYILQEVDKDGICSKNDAQALPKFLAKWEIIGITIQTINNQTHICNMRFAIGVEEFFMDKFINAFIKYSKKFTQKNLERHSTIMIYQDLYSQLKLFYQNNDNR